MPERKPTLHVFTEYNRLSRIESHWKDCFLDSDFSDYNVNIVDGTLIDHDSYLHADTHFKSIQLKRVMDMLNEDKIWDGDIFLFTNAWNYIAVPLSYFRDEYGLQIKMIGYWGNSMFNPDSPMHHRFLRKQRQFATHFESSLFMAYDVNCFLSTEHRDMFFTRYGKDKSNAAKSEVTGYPFGYLMNKWPDNPLELEKENSIILPFWLGDHDQAIVYEGLSGEFPQYKFYYAQRTHNHRSRYLELLSKCKIMFCGMSLEYNPVLLWEGMLAGVYPMVPDLGIYKTMFPEHYQYPQNLTITSRRNPILKIVRNRLQTVYIIKDLMRDYEENMERLVKDAYQIGNQYYSNKPTLKLLKNIFKTK